MLGENTLKIKLTAFVIFIVAAMFMPLTEVKAEEAPEVLVNGITYTIDEENKTALVGEYKNKGDSTCKETTILSQVSYAGENYPVTEIAVSAFSSSFCLEKITIPGTVKKIGVNAFGGCSTLTEINLSDGLEVIDEAAFINCSSLEEIVIPNTVTYVGRALFLGCEKLKKIVIPNSVTKMEGNCFQGCIALEEIVLSENITTIGYATFVDCEKLEQITIPDKVTKIESYAFVNCTNLKEVVIPDSVTTIEDGAFASCTSLTQVVIPEGVTEADEDAFGGCIGLESIFYPEHLKDGFVNPYLKEATQFSYIINADGTISLKIEYLPEGMTDIDLPSDIGGRKISSITGPEGMEIAITCVEHFFKEYSKDVSEHWYVCSVCKKEIREKHVHKSDAATGSQPCVCGYVPFVIAAQPVNQQLPYAYTNGGLAVTAKATVGKEKITYQWYEGGKAIAGATDSAYTIPTGKKVGSYNYTCKITCGSYSKVTTAANVTVQAPAKGKKYKDDANMATYKVTKAAVDGSGKAEYVKPVNKKKKVVTIPATVKIGGVIYKVTSIAKNAFKNNRYIKRLTIEKNVEKIGTKAFFNCKKLKNITIKTKKLKTKKIGANAFKKTKSNITVNVPKKKLKTYKTMLMKKGVSTKAKIR